MSRPSGFEFSRLAEDVVITHRGKRAVTLRGDAAVRFLTYIMEAMRSLVLHDLEWAAIGFGGSPSWPALER